LPVGDALRIARQVAASLAVAHEHGIVHRDLKPDNVYLIHDGEAHGGERSKILDFGICKLRRDDVRITGSGVMVGTPVYMSPEQCRGNSNEIDHRSDIYALGCVLFHMLTGRAPFEHDAPGDFIVSHMNEQPPTPSSIVPALPPLVDDILMRCLAKSPADRYQSMGELHAAIGNALDRISAPGVATQLARPALVLGAGYRSVYDANMGSAVATHGDKPQIQIVDTGEWHTPAPSLKPSLFKFFAVAAVLLLVIAAIVVSRVEVGGASAVAEPSYRYTTPVEPVPSAPAIEATAPQATNESAVAPQETVPEPVTEPVIEAPPAAPQQIHKPKPKLKPTPRRKAPARSTTTTTEDLYDTR
jgi:hypothetical protein